MCEVQRENEGVDGQVTTREAVYKVPPAQGGVSKGLDREEIGYSAREVAQGGGGGSKGSGQAQECRTLTVIIKDAQNHEIGFKIKEDMRLGRMFERYTDERGLARGSCHFYHNGVLDHNSTAKQLGLEEGDKIHSMLTGFTI